MPGSPPKSVNEPGTNPPPSTLFNSLFFVFKRASAWVEISEMRCGFALRFASTPLSNRAELLFQSLASAFWTISSAMVFHSLQELHWPCHLAYWAPQFWQKKVVFVLAIIVQLK